MSNKVIQLRPTTPEEKALQHSVDILTAVKACIAAADTVADFHCIARVIDDAVPRPLRPYLRSLLLAKIVSVAA